MEHNIDGNVTETRRIWKTVFNKR